MYNQKFVNIFMAETEVGDNRAQVQDNKISNPVSMTTMEKVLFCHLDASLLGM